MNSSKQIYREKQVFRYLAALDRGDFATVSAVLKLAEADPVLEQMLLETGDALAEESSAYLMPSENKIQQNGGKSMGVQSIPNRQLLNKSHVENNRKGSLSPTLVAVMILCVAAVGLLVMIINAPQPDEPDMGAGIVLTGDTPQPSQQMQPTPIPTQFFGLAHPLSVILVEAEPGESSTVRLERLLAARQQSGIDKAVLIFEPLVVYSSTEPDALEMTTLSAGDIFTVFNFVSLDRLNSSRRFVGKQYLAMVGLEDGVVGYVDVTFNTLLNEIPGQAGGATPIPGIVPTASPIASATLVPSPTFIPTATPAPSATFAPTAIPPMPEPTLVNSSADGDTEG